MPQDKIPRDALFITTKIHPRDFGYERTLSAFEDSISKLKTDFLDLLLLHSPWCWDVRRRLWLLRPGLEQCSHDALGIVFRQGLCEEDPERGTYHDAWRALEDLYAKGRVRAIGVSNFPAHLLQELNSTARFGIHAVQNWMDPLHQDRQARDWCEREGVLYTSYSTLGTQWHSSGGTNRVLGHPVITEIAKAHGVSPAMVVLSWALEEGAAVIPRSADPAHIEDLARLLGDDPTQGSLPSFLTAQDIERINHLDLEEGVGES